MRIKLFVIPNKEKDEDEAVSLPEGWHPINVEPSEMGCIYVWAYEKSVWRSTSEGWVHTDGRKLEAM